jgi:hypothetical protein
VQPRRVRGDGRTMRHGAIIAAPSTAAAIVMDPQPPPASNTVDQTSAATGVGNPTNVWPSSVWATL